MVMSYLHKECGIIHKDLNPSNIMITFDFDVKITDFGLSQEIKNGMSKEKVFEGTLAYSSPEMIENASVDEKADVWSFGCVLYELIAFVQPFQSTNPLTLAKMISNCEYEPIMMDTKLAGMVSRCLVRSPSNRPCVKDLLVDMIDEIVSYTSTLKRPKESNLRHL